MPKTTTTSKNPKEDGEVVDQGTHQTKVNSLVMPINETSDVIDIEPADETFKTMTQDELETKPTKKKRRFSMWLRIFLIVLLLLILAVAAVAFWAYNTFLPPAKKAETAARSLQQLSVQMQQAARDKDLVVMQDTLGQAKTKLNDLESAVKEVSFVKSWPYMAPYFEDSDNGIAAGRSLIQAGEIGIEAIKPYADLLGLKTGQDAPAENTQDRIQLLMTTLEKIEPQIDSIAVQIQLANQSLSKIDANRYPEEVQGVEIKSQLTEAKDALSAASVVLDQARPLVKVIPSLMGVEKPMTYLVLLQNDAEIRPTGGFITAYALLKVDKGKVSTQLTSDIYDLDNRYTGKDLAPQSLIDHIADPYKKEQMAGKKPIWRLRDRNLSPDFKQSAQDFLKGYKDTNSPKYDGVVAMDTKVLLSLLEVTGPIGVAGFTSISPEIDERCNCPQAIYELEGAISYETPYIRENRKAVLGNVMYSILLNSMAQPKEKFPLLAEAAFKSLQQKNVLFYFPDEEFQQAMEQMNAAGRVVNADGDYLLVVDTNLGGRKSQLYIDQQFDLQVNTQPTGTKNVLNLTYKNDQADDKWLNGISPNWLRVYVPQGSKLLTSKGSELEVKTYDEQDKTVFEAFFEVKPKGISKLTFEYETPISSKDNQYKLLVQKQPGASNHQLKVTVNGQEVAIPERLKIVDSKDAKVGILDSDKSITVHL